MFHPGNFHFHQPLDGGKVLFISGATDHHGSARLAGPACATDPVYIVFRMAGHVIVEDMAHIRDIQPTRRHIRGHKKTQGARSKIIQSFRTLRLIQIAMNWRGIKAVFLHGLGHHIDIHFAIAKDDGIGAIFRFALNHTAQERAFFGAFAIFAAGFEHHDRLGDCIRGGCSAGDFYFGGR